VLSHFRINFNAKVIFKLRVIGSKLIQLVKAANQGEAPAAARDFMRGIRQALDA